MVTPLRTEIVFHPHRQGQRHHDTSRPAIPIGLVTPHGKLIDKQAFALLSKADRVRAYLLMVYPSPRHTRVLARACTVPRQSIATLLRRDVQAGLVQSVGRGHYRATPDKPPAHVQRERRKG